MNYWELVSFGPPEENKCEKCEADFVHPRTELVMELEKDRNNTPISKLVPATVKDLEWDHFTKKSASEIGVPLP